MPRDGGIRDLAERSLVGPKSEGQTSDKPKGFREWLREQLPKQYHLTSDPRMFMVTLFRNWKVELFSSGTFVATCEVLPGGYVIVQVEEAWLERFRKLGRSFEQAFPGTQVHVEIYRRPAES